MHSTHEQVVEVPRAGFAALHARWRTLQDALDTALMAIGAVLMLAMMLLVVADVSLRYLFNAPLVWSYEVISSYLMPAVFFLAVSHTLKVHGHVAVDLLHQRMGRRLRYAVHAALAVLAAPVFAWAAFAAAQRTWAEFAAGDVSTSGLGVPSWSVSVLLPLGFGLLALRLLLDAAGFAGTLLTGRAWVGLPPLSGVDEGARAMIAGGLTVLLFLLLAAGMPVAFALAVAGSVGLLLVGGVDTLTGVLTTAPLSSAGSYELISVPMFILMAELVILSGVADNLFKAAAAWVGRVPGGLAMATALAGAGFGAISGSSTASAATLSSTTLPAMLRQGYEPKLAAGVVAISGTLAMLIPPSIALVLYGIIADVSIGQLLVGGVIPGILVTLTIMATVWVLVKLEPSRAPVAAQHTLREKIATLRVVGPMLMLFMAVTGVIYTGIATPTEAAGLGAFGAFVLALAARRVDRKSLLRTLTNAGHASCMIIMIVVCAKVFGYFFTLTQATQAIVQWVGALDLSRWVVIALILLGYVLLGCVMDQVAILILTVPIVLPLVKALGFDPVWFGVVVIVVAEVGLVTPPVGLNVFVVSRYARRPLKEVFDGVWPHVFSHLLLLAVLVAFPQIILWLPSRMAP